MTRNGSFVMLLPLRCSLRGLMTRASRPTSSIAISLFHWHTQQLLAQRDGKRHQREREREACRVKGNDVLSSMDERE